MTARSRVSILSGAAIAAAVASLISTGVTRAIGPDYQYISDAPPVGTFNDVVSLTGNGFLGTGSVIGYMDTDNLPIDELQDGDEVCLAILTANHVAKDITPANNATANWGDGPNAPGGSYKFINNVGPYVTYTLTDPVNNPNNLTEDISIMQSVITLDSSNFNYVTGTILPNILSLSNAMELPEGTGTYYQLNSEDQVNFTEVGYGRGGVWNGTDYNTNSPTGARRFQNNTITNATAPAVQLGGAYFEPLVGQTILAPSAAGGGTSKPGDSGGPYLTGGDSSEVSVTPEYTDDNIWPEGELPEPGIPINVPIDYSDDLSAVHVGAQGYNDLVPAAVGGKVPGNLNWGVPLIGGDGGSLEWAEDYAENPCVIPEPAPLLLLAFGGIPLLLRRRRKA